ncbi:MAG: GNAT family N-acetyltransferase [Chitinophagaceae bacterium]|nr:GNAT family N-acetyltransferase [Chitinophagaceae bacterium]
MLEINVVGFPAINTERLRLRAVNQADAEQILAIRSNELVLQYMDTKRMERLDEAFAFLQFIETAYINKTGITWGIALHENDKIIGTIAYWRIMREHYRAEIGYSLLADFWGKGIMLEAMKSVLQFGFQVLKLHSIEANVNPANQPSIKLLERSGFVKEAHFKENYYFNGRFLDSAIYSLITPS